MTHADFKKRILVCVAVIVIMFGIVFSAAPNIAYAAETGLNYDKTNVLDDLSSSTVNGQPFDIRSFPFDESGTVQVIDFVEYCYSYRANTRDNYGLYLYVYNPQGLNISTNSKSNRVQMAVSYDSEGKPNGYGKFALEFCSKTESGDYKNLFYKFKVVDRKIDGKTFAERVNSNERRYDVSGIELTTHGASNAVEYNVSGSYIFTGYAEGCGPEVNAKSTLNCKVNFLETVQLEVKHTFYRTKTSAKGAGYQNQMDTVYFAVPQRFFDDYGSLQRIKAEWYEYKTNDIVVTSNSDFYNKASPYIGVQTGEFDKFGMTVYNETIGISLGQDAGDYGGGMNGAKWGWNLGSGYLHIPAPALYYLFKVNDISEYDPYADVVSIGGVQSNALYEYIKGYDKSYEKGKLPIKDGTISADLFTDDIDDYRKLDTEYGKIQKGYSYYDFDADVDLQKLSAWSEGNPSFWDNWINWGLWDAMTGNIPNESGRTVSPIYTLKNGDLSGTDAEIAERLLVNASDVSNLRDFYNQSVKDDKVVVLFRFATSDYYSAAVDIIELNKGFMWSDKHTKGQAYRAYESVFFDFDIIQLTFNRDGAYRVIPVVSSPIDVVNAITPPVQMPDDVPWWKIVLGIVLLVLLLILLFPVLPYVFKGIWWLICLPFKAIAALFKAIGRRAKKPKETKEYKEKKPKKDKKRKEKAVTQDATVTDFANGDWYLDDMDIWEEME